MSLEFKVMFGFWKYKRKKKNVKKNDFFHI